MAWRGLRRCACRPRKYFGSYMNRDRAQSGHRFRHRKVAKCSCGSAPAQQNALPSPAELYLTVSLHQVGLSFVLAWAIHFGRNYSCGRLRGRGTRTSHARSRRLIYHTENMRLKRESIAPRPSNRSCGLRVPPSHFELQRCSSSFGLPNVLV